MSLARSVAELKKPPYGGNDLGGGKISPLQAAIQVAQEEREALLAMKQAKAAGA